MHRSRVGLAAAVAAAAISLVSFAPASADTPLPTDPRLKTGELENGLKYVVLKHANPPGRVSLYLHISTGSLNETDAQRGIAHYTEHMAFNGSEHFPPGSVVPLFESMGLTFGRHQNASTGFDETTYILALPNTQDETINKGMTFLSDVLMHLTLPTEEIDKERQVIMEEKRSRLGAQQRVIEQVLAKVAPGSLIGQRLPIGVEETIMGVKQSDFKDYYSRWYTPSNAEVVAVGDIDEAKLEAAIKAAFAGGVKTPRPVDQDAKVAPYSKPFAMVITDPELTESEVSFVRVDAAVPPTTTEELARQRLIEEVATIAFDRRMDAKKAESKVSWVSSSSSIEDLFNTARWIQMGANGESGKWRVMLTDLGREVQRARLHGFTEREIDDVRKQVLAGAEQFARQESTLDARILIRQIIGSLQSGETKMSAAQQLDLMKKLLPSVDASSVSAVFARMFDPAAMAVSLQAPTSVDGGVPSEADLLTAATEALNVKPEKDSEVARAVALMAHIPEPAKIAAEETHDASAVWSAWFENGVRVHHRFMDIEKDSASVSILLAAGPIQETAENRTVSRAATVAFGEPATGSLSSTQVRDLMTGKNVRVGGTIAGVDSVMLSVSGSPADLESGMQLAHLLLTDPVVENTALENWRTETIQQIDQREKDPQQAFRFLLQSALYPQDVRLQPHTREQVKAVTREAAQKRIKDIVATAPIEVTIVGDISKEKARELAARYLGTLPKRDRISPQTLASLKDVKRSGTPVERVQRLSTKTPVAIVACGFYGPDADNIPDSRAMDLASKVLSTRMIKTIREEKNLVYSIGAQVQADRALKGFGVFLAAAPTADDKCDALSAALHEMYAAFAKDGPTEEEMTVARKQSANSFDETMKTSRFWSGAIGAMDFRASKLDDVVGAPAAVQEITAKQVQETFAKYYKPDATIKVMLRPEAAAASEK